VRRLRGGIPRTFANHRTPIGYAYRDLLLAKLERLGPLPADAKVTLREYGRLALDMQRLHLEQDRAVKRGRVTMARRIDKRLTPMRTQLAVLEARLEELAAIQRKAPTLVEVIRRRGEA
jgi:hypothetical protein